MTVYEAIQELAQHDPHEEIHLDVMKHVPFSYDDVDFRDPRNPVYVLNCKVKVRHVDEAAKGIFVHLD